MAGKRADRDADMGADGAQEPEIASSHDGIPASQRDKKRQGGAMEKHGSIHAGHRERLRERFRRGGLSSFSEHEALELLLTYAIPQRDVNPLAHELIERFGSFSAVLEADESELLRVDGVGKNASLLLTMLPHLMGYYHRSAMGDRPVIHNLITAKRYAGALFIGAHQEHVYMICMDQSGRVLHPALLYKGTVDEVKLYPREVVETALRYHAHAVLLAHNHPSGQCDPSQADYDTTRRIISALRAIDVSVVDHLIFAGDSVYSMTRNSQCADQPEEEVSYVLRSRHVPGRRGTLREEQEERLQALVLEP